MTSKTALTTCGPTRPGDGLRSSPQEAAKRARRPELSHRRQPTPRAVPQQSGVGTAHWLIPWSPRSDTHWRGGAVSGKQWIRVTYPLESSQTVRQV